MKATGYLLLTGLVWLLCSCGGKGNPHRAPSEPFQVVETYLRTSDLVEGASFDYEGESVWLNGEVELDRKVDSIRLRGTYRTRQKLEDGAALAIQCYGLDGELLVRDLPRWVFKSTADGMLEAEFDSSYTCWDWGIGFDRKSVLIQFNYIQEGQFWYDMAYPDLELPSIVFQNVSALERFRTLIGPIPWFVPIGMECFLPVVFEADKTHEGDFSYVSSVEVFTRSDKERHEQVRRELESTISLGAGRHLIVGRARFDENREYQLRHGFVWDGVRWYGDSEDIGGYELVRAVPSSVYLSVFALVFVLLRFVWNYAKSIKVALARWALRGVIVAIGLLAIGISMTNSGFLVLLALGFGWYVSQLSGFLNGRLYVLGLLLFALLEVYWGWLFAASSASPSGMLLSICIYAFALAPILWIRRSSVSLVLLAVATTCGLFIYILMDLYASFFTDYPSLKVIGYAGQVLTISDSVWSLIGEPHGISLAIVAVFWVFLLRTQWGSRLA